MNATTFLKNPKYREMVRKIGERISGNIPAPIFWGTYSAKMRGLFTSYEVARRVLHPLANQREERRVDKYIDENRTLPVFIRKSVKNKKKAH